MEWIQWSWVIWFILLFICFAADKLFIDGCDNNIVNAIISILCLLSICLIIIIPCLNMSLIGEIDKSKTKVEYFMPDTIIKTNYVTYVLNFNHSISLCSSNAAIYNRNDQLVIQQDSHYSYYNNLLEKNLTLNMADLSKTNSP